MKARLVIALLLGTISIQNQFNNECQATLLKGNIIGDSDEMEDLINQALGGGSGKKKQPVEEAPQTADEFVESALDAKLDSTVYTSPEKTYLPKWNAPYSQASNNGRPTLGMDVEYGEPGSDDLISGTTSDEINSIIKNQPGDASLGFKNNVDIPSYKGSDEIVDLSTSEYAPSLSSSSNEDCEERSPQEEAAFQAAYKTAYAAAKGGASAAETKLAAKSAIYGTGQGNLKSYEYNVDCPECQSVLDGSELETSDTGIQQRQKKGGRVQMAPTKDDTYADQAEGILEETLDKDINKYQSKMARQAQECKDKENESDQVFDQAIDLIPKSQRRYNAAQRENEQEDEQFVDLFADPSNLLQLDSQLNIDESHKSNEKSQSFTWTQEELKENKNSKSVYTDFTDE